MKASIAKKRLEDIFGKPLIPEEEQLSSLVYWYPILLDIGMRVPKTIIVHRGLSDLSGMLDGKAIPREFNERLIAAMKEIGFPCFMRTGQTSYKHGWKNTCFIERQEDVASHVYRLLEASAMANIAGRPFSCDFWAIREMIPTTPLLTYFDGMPIALEVRFFINGGKVQCVHPYWPQEAFTTDDANIHKKVKALQIFVKSKDEVYQMAEYVALYFNGYWSVDFLQGTNGDWWCIDMGTGGRSWHWPTCEYVKSIGNTRRR